MSTDARILEAALRVFLEEGHAAATTRRIAAEAGVNEVTLFRRFGNKDHLLVEALRRDAYERVTPVGPGEDPEAELAAWARGAAQGLLRVRGLLRATIAERLKAPDMCRHANDGPLRLRQTLEAWMKGLQAAGRAHADADVPAAAHLLLDGVFTTVMRPDPTLALEPDLDAVITRYVRLVLRAIGTLPVASPRDPC